MRLDGETARRKRRAPGLSAIRVASSTPPAETITSWELAALVHAPPTTWAHWGRAVKTASRRTPTVELVGPPPPPPAATATAMPAAAPTPSRIGTVLDLPFGGFAVEAVLGAVEEATGCPASLSAWS